jgi:hypothetical protein
MKALLEMFIGWFWPRTIPFAFSSGQIARNLAQFKSVGCLTRIAGKCPHERELFGCADCSREEGQSLVLPRM